MNRRPGFVRRLFEDTAGTATTETVIMIPMFAIVWGSIFFVFTFFQRTIEMRSITRRDTWMYAYTACQTTPTFSGANAGTPATLSCSQDSNFGGDESTSGAGSLVTTLMRFIPGFTVKMTTGSSTRTVTRPTVLGGGNMDLRDRLWILRNEQPQGVASFLASLITEFVGF